MTFHALLHLRQRLRRRRRRILTFCFVVVALTALTWGVLVEGTLLRYGVAWVIGYRVNAVCTIDDFRWSGWNRAVIRGLSVQVKDWTPEAAEVIRIGEMSADFDPLPLLWGSLALTDIRIDRMSIPLVINSETGLLNLMSMDLPEVRPSSRPAPRINILNLDMQIGSLDPSTGVVHWEGRHELVGQVRSDNTAPGIWTLSMHQQPRPGAPSATIEGEIRADPFSYSLDLTNFVLDESLHRLLPEPVRQVWPYMDLEGRIDSITLSGDRDQPVSTARIAVSNIELTLPELGVHDLWASYSAGRVLPIAGPPRIRVSRGELELRDRVLMLNELRGELVSSDPAVRAVPLPVFLSFWIDLDRGSLRSWSREAANAWVAEALEHAPFSLHLEIPQYGYDPGPDDPTVLELPRLAAEILQNFNVMRGRVSINAFVTRDNPVWRGGSRPGAGTPHQPPIPAEVRVQGSVFIDGGEGGYVQFPYRLQEVRARITFEDDLVRVESLHGRGSQGAPISIAGTVIDPGGDPGIDLRIITPRAPIDEVLIAALVRSPAQRFLTLLFCMPAFQSLQEAGLPQREVEAMRAERHRLLSALESGGRPLSPSERDRLSARIVQLGAVDWLARFRPGGWCGLDLRVQREVGAGDLISTTGTITLYEAEALCEMLPYPLRVHGRQVVGDAGAVITVEDERILLPPAGLELQLPGGGRGTITGWIDLPRDADGDRIVTPAITIRTSGDAINELLLAAIPADDPNGPIKGPGAGWPGSRRSEAAEVLQRIGLRGNLASTIHIGGDGQGEITWRLEVDLSDGHASPTEGVGAELTESGLEWPAGFTLEACTARLLVDDRMVTLQHFEGRRGEGIVEARGEIDLRNGDRRLEVEFRGVSPGEYLVNLLPRERRERGRDLWKAHRPAGLFDATLLWNSAQGGTTRRILEVRPRWFEFDTVVPPSVTGLDSTRVRLTRQQGLIRIVDSSASARALAISIDETGLPPSHLLLDGPLAAHPSTHAPPLRMEWSGVDFGSTLLLEALQMAGVERAVELWDRFKPRGSFHAVLTRTIDSRGEPTVRAELRPESIDATIDGAPTSLRVDSASPPIVIEPPLLKLRDLVVWSPNGRFELHGDAPLEASAAEDGLVRVAYRGERFGPPEIALTGGAARRAIDAIDLVLDAPVRIDDGAILFGAREDELALGFRGRIRIDDASFRAGVGFTELGAWLDLDVPPTGGADLRIRSPRFRVMGYAVEDSAARIVVAPDAAWVRIDPLTGVFAGGSASAQGFVRIDPSSSDGGDYWVRVALVGAQLGEVPLEHTSPTAASEAPTAGEGRLDGSVTIGGPLDRPLLRSGRGRVEIRDGRMAELPITMSLLQVSQLMLPLNTSLDAGDIRFHIDGDHLVFERFDLTCPTLEFQGTGEFDLRNDELSLRFRNRGTLPVWRDLLAAVSQTLFAIDVRGPLRDPRVSVAPLPPFNRPPQRPTEAAP